MNKEIFISESMGESRIAIIEDGTLVREYEQMLEDTEIPEIDRFHIEEHHRGLH